MKKAKVIRPMFDESLADHPLVRLTATVKSGNVTKEYEKLVRVKMKGITNSQAIVLDLNAIKLPAETTLSNIILPKVGANGSTISWTSNVSDVISPEGTVVRPNAGQENVEVKLTATASKGSESQEKQFNITVIAWTKEEELEDAVKQVNWDLIKGTNTNSQNITDNLVLPGVVGRNVQATWTTASSNLDTKTGKITRPSYTQGQVTLKITCKLVHGDLNQTVDLDMFIIACLPMTDQEVLIAAKNMLEPNVFLGENESVSKITTNMQLPFRVSDSDASRATISWSLASSPEHTPLSSSKYIALSNMAEYTLANITRPTSEEGNQKVGLKAEISVGKDDEKKTDTKYFDLTIVVDSESAVTA